MGIFGFTWADGGAFVGGALGAAFFGPPGAMLGSAVGSFAGGVWGDDKGTGAAAEEALVAGIGAAGGAWATNLAGKLLKDGIASAATRKLSAGAAQRVDRAATKTLMPWNSHGGGPIAALGGAFGGYEVSVQARLPVQIDTTDIGNGGCPAQMANLRMPAELTGSVGDMYRDLPGYLCDVWQSFGTGSRKAPPAPELPAQVSGAGAGIPDYVAKAQQLNTMAAGFAELDARAVDLIAKGADRITGEGRMAVGSLIDTVNRRAAETAQSGASVEAHALDLLDDAFGQGREILSQAVASSDRVAGRVRDLTGELDSLRAEFDKHVDEHRPQPGPSPALSAPPAPLAPPVAPCIVVPAPPCNGMSVPGGADAGGTQRQSSSAESGTSVPVPPQPRSGAGSATAAPEAGSVTAAHGAAVPMPTPWSPQIAAGHPGPDPAGSRSPASVALPVESAALTPAILGWDVPSFVPAAWSRAGAPSAPDVLSGPGAPKPPSVPSGPAVPAVPGPTPWTGFATSPMTAVAAVPAAVLGAPGPGDGRGRPAGDTERESAIDDSAGRPTPAHSFTVLVEPPGGRYYAGVCAGHELPR